MEGRRIRKACLGYPGEEKLRAGSKRGHATGAKTSCRRLAANQACLLMGVLAYNLLHMLRQFYLIGEEVTRSMEWFIKRLIKVGVKLASHARSRHVLVASAFSLAVHYRTVFGSGAQM